MKTIRIKLKTAFATAGGGPAYEKGEEVDWPADDAEQIITKGYAERVQPPARK